MFQGHENTLCDIVMTIDVIMHLSKAIEFTTPRMNPKVSYTLQMIMIYPFSFILGKKKKSTVLVSDADDNGEATQMWG